MAKPESYTVIPGLLNPISPEDVLEVNADSTPGGDWYGLLRNIELPLYYVALNGQIFLATYSDRVAYNTYYQCMGRGVISMQGVDTTLLKRVLEVLL